MLIPVHDIPLTGREFDISLEQEDLDLDMRLLKPVHFKGTSYRSGKDVRITGNISTILEASCHRCLEPFPFKIDTHVELYYRPDASQSFEENQEISVEELGILHYRDNTIDLGEAIHDTIILEMPMKILCRPDCRGLCSQCGNNLNLGSCDCKKPEESHNPFKEFFNSRRP